MRNTDIDIRLTFKLYTCTLLSVPPLYTIWLTTERHSGVLVCPSSTWISRPVIASRTHIAQSLDATHRSLRTPSMADARHVMPDSAHDIAGPLRYSCRDRYPRIRYHGTGTNIFVFIQLLFNFFTAPSSYLVIVR